MMEIFKLFGSIFVDNDKADKAIDETDKKGKGLSLTFGDMGKAAKVMGGLIVAGVGAAATAVGGLIIAGDNLQKALNALEMQTGASTTEMKGMEKSLINIYKAGYGESFQDIADSMANVRQVTSLTGEELENATKEALKMRDAFGFEVNESVRTVSVMMKNFGITSKEAFTLLAQGQQLGVNASDDMLDTFLEYSPLFKQLGFDAEAMLNILNDGMKNGVRNSDVLADAVKEFGIRVKDGSKTSSEAFAGLGLNASKMAQEFARGGDSAQSAFEKTMAALGKIEDPVERNTIGVSLFGTKFEDLEYQAILSLGHVEKVANQSGDTLKKIDEIRFNTIGEAIEGIWRQINASLLIPIEQKMMPGINKAFQTAKEIIPSIIEMFKGNSLPLIEYVTKSFSKDKQMPIINFFLSIRDGVEQVKVYLDQAREVIDAFFAALSGNKGGAISMLSRAGLSSDQIQLFLQAVDTIKTYLNNLAVYWSMIWSGLKYAVSELWNFLGPLIMPALSAIVGFIQEQLGLIKQFWDENGSQIVEAVKNAFNFIMSIIQFVMPAVLFLIQSIWGNIKGVISGALDIIMGVIRVFTGLFTGDFSMMWEGIKQLFFGALEFLWNLFNLIMIGKFLGGIKAFISSGIGFFKNFGTAAVDTFKSFFDSIITWFQYFRATGASIWEAAIAVFKNAITLFVQSARSGFSSMLETATNIFNGVKNAILHPIQTAKDQVKGFIDEIKSFFNNMKLKLPEIKTPKFKLKNWSKNPLDWLKAMPSIDVDWYAKGTNYAPGGLAVVGEQGPELVQLPRGSKVHTASKTKEMLREEEKAPVIIQIVTPEKREVARWLVDDITEFQEFYLTRFGG
jgi:TP901 family phage tail tape measure protein